MKGREEGRRPMSGTTKMSGICGWRGRIHYQKFSLSLFPREFENCQYNSNDGDCNCGGSSRGSNRTLMSSCGQIGSQEWTSHGHARHLFETRTDDKVSLELPFVEAPKFGRTLVHRVQARLARDPAKSLARWPQEDARCWRRIVL